MNITLRTICAATVATMALTAQAVKTDKLYHRLDSLIAQQHNILKDKEQRITTIKEALYDTTLTNQQRYKINK